jgi:hypothetical protein
LCDKYLAWLVWWMKIIRWCRIKLVKVSHWCGRRKLGWYHVKRTNWMKILYHCVLY